MMERERQQNDRTLNGLGWDVPTWAGQSQSMQQIWTAFEHDGLKHLARITLWPGRPNEQFRNFF